MVEQLIDKLIHHNIPIRLVKHDQLQVGADINAVPAALLAEIRAHKTELINYLRSTNDGGSTIPVAPGADGYVLSSNQLRLWIISQLHESSVAYHVPGVQFYEGELDPPALSNAFRSLVERHEILRTVFREDATGEPKQYVLSPAGMSVDIPFHDLRRATDKEDQLRQFIDRAIATPFNLRTGPLLRIQLFRMDTQRWAIVHVMHHITCDGWSAGILTNELLACYRGNTVRPPLRIQYKDYAVWQQQQLSSGGLNTAREYWLKTFHGELPIIELPYDKPRPALKTFSGAAVQKKIDPSVSNAFQALVKAEGATLFMGMLAVLNVLLYRYTEQEDIIIGSPVAGRELPELENQIGFYANTLALRTRFTGKEGFSKILQRTRQVCLAAYDHQLYPFGELVKELGLQWNAGRNPLFDIMIVVNEAGKENDDAIKTSVTKFDLFFHFNDTPGGLHVNIEYNTDIFFEQTITRLATHLEQLMTRIVQEPRVAIEELDYLAAQEKNQLLTDFNNTTTDYPQDKTMIALFEEQVQKKPGAVALVFNGQSYSYHQLNEEANRLGHYLRSKYAIQPNHLVAICLERSEQMIMAILGILKAGAAYIPIDPDYPAQRIDYIRQQSGCRLVIDNKAFNEFLQEKTLYKNENPPPVNQPKDLLYVIYTSGSTGQPKGCMLENGSIVNRLQWMWQFYGFDEDDVILQKTTYTFDVSVWELFLPLCWGARMVLCAKEDLTSPQKILWLIRQHQVTCLHFVPGMLNTFMASVFDQQGIAENLSSLRRVITSGEALTVETVRKWYRQTSIPLCNLYGPTEASVDVSYYNTHPADEKIPIGKPIWNTRLYITDRNDRLVPVGVTGEISIGGVGLARGYLEQPALTAEKFRPDPFIPGQRIYKTGDRGRWLPDGNIEYFGRKDGQVKVRGFRIETGEVENAIQVYPGVRSVAVIARKAGDENELVAYICCDQALQYTSLRRFLQDRLPVYMLPAYFIQLEKMPLTSSGKTDRKALAAMELPGDPLSADYVAPRTPLQSQLVSIWQEVLGKKRVGITDDYFQLGGSSLKAMILIKRIMDATGFLLPMKTLVEERTIERIAPLLAQPSFADIIPGQVPVVAELYPVSYNQSMYFSAWNSPIDNIVVSRYDFKELHADAFIEAVRRLADRHEILRTIFVQVDGRMMQKIIPVQDFAFETGPVALATENEIAAFMEQQYDHEFDLSDASLFAIKIFKSAAGFTVIITMHHIIVDGYSGGIIRNDLQKLYTAIITGSNAGLPALPWRYVDFCHWQHHFLSSDQGIQHRNYWLRRLAGFQPALHLPWAASVKTFSKANVTGTTVLIDKDRFLQLEEFTKTNAITRPAALLGVLVLAFNKISGQDDITIFTPVSGRNSRYYGQLDVSGLVGFFTNFLVVRNIIQPQKNTIELLQTIQASFLEDLAHDAYPTDRLLHELPGIAAENMLRSTLFFNYHNYDYLQQAVYTNNPAGEEVKKLGNATMEQAFILSVTEFANCLRLHFVFNTDLFSPPQRIMVKELYVQMLSQLIHH